MNVPLFDKMSELLNRFSIFSKISEEIKREIKIFHVFDDCFERQNVLFITSDDKVFGFGYNTYGCCGLGHNSVVNEPQIAPELFHKSIQQFYIGISFCLGLSSDNRVFGWGSNTFGQLGRGYVSGSDEYLKPEIIDFPFESIIQLSCGSEHTLALSCDGRVYGWGDNRFGQIGCGKECGKVITKPIQLKTFIPYSVKILNSFEERSYAVTTEGLVYSWGRNFWCSLGHDCGGNESVFEPKLIVNIPKIKLICTSIVNTYFLTNESDLYFCGFFKNDENEGLLQRTPILSIRGMFSTLHNSNYEITTALSQNIIYRIYGNKIDKSFHISYFDYYSFNHEFCYKTIHINSEKIFDGNDLNDLYNYKNKNFGETFEISKIICTGSFGKIYKVKYKYYQEQFAIKQILLNGKLFI